MRGKRFSMKVLVGALSLSLAALLVPMAVPSAQPPARAQDEGTDLRVATTQEADSLNPFLGYTLLTTSVFRLNYPTLTTYSPKNFDPMPELATHWETSPDKRTWTFHIREGVKWSDNQPVTAKDAAFTYNLIMRDDAAATANGSFVENFESVRATDDHTLVVRTKTPQATMLAIDIPIVPEHVWSKVRNIADFTNDKMPVVSSGPFTLTGYKPQESITLKANKQYWRGAPKIDELHFVLYKNTDAAVQALRKGEVDLTYDLTSTQFESLAGQENVKQVEGRDRRFTELVLNPGAADSTGKPIGTGHPALRDVRVRHAIDRAIDRKAIIQRVYGGHGEVGTGYIPPIFADYHWNPPPDQRRTFDPAAANRALDDAGYHRGPDGIRRTPQGQPLNFELISHGDDAQETQMTQFIKGWMRDIGVNVSLKPVSDSQLNDRATAGDFDMIMSGWSVNPDPDYVLNLQTCASRPDPDGGGATPDSFLCDKRYDELYKQQLRTFDDQRRSEIVKQMQRRFYDQAAGLILFYDAKLEAYRSDKFAGFTMQPANNGMITGQQGHWSYAEARPVAASERGGSTNYGAIAGIVVGAIVVLGVGGWLIARRRQAGAEERE